MFTLPRRCNDGRRDIRGMSGHPAPLYAPTSTRAPSTSKHHCGIATQLANHVWGHTLPLASHGGVNDVEHWSTCPALHQYYDAGLTVGVAMLCDPKDQDTIRMAASIRALPVRSINMTIAQKWEVTQPQMQGDCMCWLFGAYHYWLGSPSGLRRWADNVERTWV